MSWRHWRSGELGAIAIVVFAIAPGVSSAGFIPALPEWSRQYEVIVADFSGVVAAAHRLDLAHGRLEQARQQGLQCEPCKLEMEVARKQRDHLVVTLSEQLEHLPAQRKEVLDHLDQLARTLYIGPSAARQGDEDLLRSVHNYRQVFERHDALGTSFMQLVRLVEELQQRTVAEPLARISPEAAEPFERAVRVLRGVAEQSFQQVAFCRQWIESMDSRKPDPGALASFRSSLEDDILVKNLGKSADLLASAPDAFRQQMQDSLDNGDVFESNYEGSRGRIYRAVVEVARQPGETIEDTEDRAKVLAARQLQQAVDGTIARLDHGRTGARVWKATFFHGLEQHAEVLDDRRVRASAEIAESDVFPLIPLPDLTPLKAYLDR